MPTSRKSDSSGRMSPDRSSERNGSRPPPSYEKTSRTSPGAATLSRLALSGFAAAAGLGLAWEASGPAASSAGPLRSEEHTSELQSRGHLVCRLLLEKKNNVRRRAIG